MAVKWIIIVIVSQVQISYQLCISKENWSKNASVENCDKRNKLNIVFVVDTIQRRREQQNHFEMAKKNLIAFIDGLNIERHEQLTLSAMVIRSNSVHSVTTSIQSPLRSKIREIKMGLEVLDLDDSENSSGGVSMLSVGLGITTDFLKSSPTIHQNHATHVVILISTDRFKDSENGDVLRKANPLKNISHVILVASGNSIGHKMHGLIVSCKDYLVKFDALNNVFLKIRQSLC